LRWVVFEQCPQIVQKLMPSVHETAPHDVIDSILKLAGMLQGAGISLTTDEPGAGDSGEDIGVRIRRAGAAARRIGAEESCAFKPSVTGHKKRPKSQLGRSG